jgi:hypothetical protein
MKPRSGTRIYKTAAWITLPNNRTVFLYSSAVCFDIMVMPRQAWLPRSGCHFVVLLATAAAPAWALLGDLAAREINAFEREDEQNIV